MNYNKDTCCCAFRNKEKESFSLMMGSSKDFVHQVKKHLYRQWLVLGLLIVILFSYLVPNLGKTNGILKTNLWVNSVCMVFIFLISGLSIQSQVLKEAFLKIHLHILIQIINLGLIPLYSFGLVYIFSLSDAIDPLLLQGLLVMSVMPATVSTCIVYTQLAKGNTALAIIDSAFGNFIGIFISPLYLIVIEQRDVQADYGALVLNLTLVVILPFIIGQIVRFILPRLAQWICRLPGFSKYTGFFILLMVWSAFSTAFSANIGVGGISILYVFLIVVLMYLINLGLTAIIFIFLNKITSNHVALNEESIIEVVDNKKFTWETTKEDVVAAMCTVPQKTLAMGLPLIQIVYSDRPTEIAIVGLPLIMYHAVQLFINGLLIPVFKKYNNPYVQQIEEDDSSDEDEAIPLNEINEKRSSDVKIEDNE